MYAIVGASQIFPFEDRVIARVGSNMKHFQILMVEERCFEFCCYRFWIVRKAGVPPVDG